MQTVTIPMTKRDKDGNVFEYRIVPLIFHDNRFRTLLNRLGHDLRTRFVKLYKRTPDAKSRTVAVEMASWLAVFVAEQLGTWFQILVELGQDPKSAAMNTFKVYGDVFEQQLKASMHAEEKEELVPGQDDDEGVAADGSENDGDVSGDAAGASGEGRISPDSDSDIESTGQEGGDTYDGKSPESVGEVQDLRSEIDRRDSVDNDPPSGGEGR